MALGIAVLALFSIVMLLVSLQLFSECRITRELLDEIRDRQKREIARLEERAHALQLQLQLATRKPPKKPAPPDPVAIKRRVMDGLSKALDEAMRG